jgi:hypothetical protein
MLFAVAHDICHAESSPNGYRCADDSSCKRRNRRNGQLQPQAAHRERESGRRRLVRRSEVRRLTDETPRKKNEVLPLVSLLALESLFHD